MQQTLDGEVKAKNEQARQKKLKDDENAELQSAIDSNEKVCLCLLRISLTSAENVCLLFCGGFPNSNRHQQILLPFFVCTKFCLLIVTECTLVELYFCSLPAGSVRLGQEGEVVVCSAEGDKRVV